jgi:hypothetical protein
MGDKITSLMLYQNVEKLKINDQRMKAKQEKGRQQSSDAELQII